MATDWKSKRWKFRINCGPLVWIWLNQKLAPWLKTEYTISQLLEWMRRLLKPWRRSIIICRIRICHQEFWNRKSNIARWPEISVISNMYMLRFLQNLRVQTHYWHGVAPKISGDSTWSEKSVSKDKAWSPKAKIKNPYVSINPLYMDAHHWSSF